MLGSIVVAALVAGLLGSVHCAFMCGPLLAAGCGAGRREALPYFAGRLVSYALAGALFGSLGAHAARHFSTVQPLLLVAVAAPALWNGLRMVFVQAPAPASTATVPLGRRDDRRFARTLAALVPRRALPLGLVTGALPCGLLATGWALAASTGRPLDGALVMIAFWLATSPGLALSLLASLPALRRRWSRRAQGISWCVLALWIGLRPLLLSAHGCHLMAELRVAFRLPGDRLLAEWVSDYGLRGGRLLVAGEPPLEAASRSALEHGVAGCLSDGRALQIRADDGEVRLWLDGVEAPREDRMRVPTSRAAWIHAFLALSGSALGFVASGWYVRRAAASGDPWAMKMAWHMAVWHLVLTLTLFPASVWGQRFGVRAVQGAALLFFLIHAGIAAANLGALVDGVGIFNAASGIAFGATAIYGQRAHRSMDPLARAP